MDENAEGGLKIKKGRWINGKRQEWSNDISDSEIAQQRVRYQDVKQRIISLETEIQNIEATMKMLVAQQLGDKSNYDSSLHELNDNHAMQTTGPAALQHEVPLEKLIRDALNYDTNYYK